MFFSLSSLSVVFAIVHTVLTCIDLVQPLHELERRARNYYADGANEPFVSDYIIDDAWYNVTQFKGQYIMPDSKKLPDYSSCGTHEVIYLEGDHPDPATLTASPVDVTACLRDTFDDCSVRYAIKIRKCGKEIQYFLVPTKQFTAYCFDPPELQENGGFSPPPTNVKLGTVHVKPELLFDKEHKLIHMQNTTNYFPRLEFRCQFEVQKELYYSVYWYRNGNYFRAFGPTQKTDELVITEKLLLDLKIVLGFNLKCGVRVSKDASGQSTALESSADFFAGIKILNPTLQVPKDETADIKMQVTVPVGCRYNVPVSANVPCYIALNMFDPKGFRCEVDSMLEIKNSKRCGQDILALKEGDTWDQHKVYKFRVTTKDENYADDVKYTLLLRTGIDVDHLLWRNYQLDYVSVIVTDGLSNKDKMCYSHVDPHMRTSDGYYFENQKLGDFLLYRNTKYNIEVQERLMKCNGNIATCACAVAIRAGADVFMINLCEKVKFIDFKECGDGGILNVVRQNDNLYKVYTPIGTAIHLSIQTGDYTNTMNVDIFMAPKDLKKTEGLCGYFDKDINNDLKKRNGNTVKINSVIREHINSHYTFSDDWSLKTDENLFSGSNRDHRPWEQENGMYCLCEQAMPGSTADPFRKPEARCYSTQYLNCIEYDTSSVTKGKCRKVTRRKRSSGLSKHEKEVERLLKLSREPTVNRIEERSVSEENITEAEARDICTENINGSLAVNEFADKTGGENPDAVINQCVFDVVTGNDKSWATVHLNSLNSIVSKEFERDPVYVENNTENVNMFIKNTCPSNCTGRGVCSDEGVCICDTYNHGPDCNIDERFPIDVLDIEGGGVCDLAEGDDCSCIYLYTTNLLRNFSCEVEGKTIYITGEEDGMALSRPKGLYEDIFTGQCCVPARRQTRSADEMNVFTVSYGIKISNDGQHFGAAETVYILDSTCQDVKVNGAMRKIVLKEECCFIDGMCKDDGDKNFVDECLICNSHSDAYNWTQNCIPTSDSNKLGVILGCSLGIGLSVVILVAAYTVWRFKMQPSMKKRKSVGDSQSFPDNGFHGTLKQNN